MKTIKTVINTLSSIIMLIGVLYGADTLIRANGVPQQLSSLVPVIFCYVTARAIQNPFN